MHQIRGEDQPGGRLLLAVSRHQGFLPVVQKTMPYGLPRQRNLFEELKVFLLRKIQRNKLRKNFLLILRQVVRRKSQTVLYSTPTKASTSKKNQAKHSMSLWSF